MSKLHPDDLMRWRQIVQGLKEGKIPGLASRRSRRAVLAIAEFLEEVLGENDQDQG